MNINASGVLTSSSPFTKAIDFLPNNIKFPATVFLTSSSGSRLIRFSVDGGVTYFTPTYDVSGTTQLVVSVLSPITHVEFTGANGDKWGIL